MLKIFAEGRSRPDRKVRLSNGTLADLLSFMRSLIRTNEGYGRGDLELAGTLDNASKGRRQPGELAGGRRRYPAAEIPGAPSCTAGPARPAACVGVACRDHARVLGP